MFSNVIPKLKTMRPEYDEDYNHEDDDSYQDAPAVCRCGEVISPFTDLVSEQTGEKVCRDCAAKENEMETFSEADYYLSLQQDYYDRL